MKYICLGYLDETVWDSMPGSAQKSFIEECLAYDTLLREQGHFVGGEALQSARTATTLRPGNGKLSITDGPFAETREQLGGIMILEATDLNQAIQLMSRHPSIRLGGGSWEIRPADERINALYKGGGDA